MVARQVRAVFGAPRARESPHPPQRPHTPQRPQLLLALYRLPECDPRLDRQVAAKAQTKQRKKSAEAEAAEAATAVVRMGGAQLLVAAMRNHEIVQSRDLHVTPPPSASASASATQLTTGAMTAGTVNASPHLLSTATVHGVVPLTARIQAAGLRALSALAQCKCAPAVAAAGGPAAVSYAMRCLPEEKFQVIGLAALAAVASGDASCRGSLHHSPALHVAAHVMRHHSAKCARWNARTAG